MLGQRFSVKTCSPLRFASGLLFCRVPRHLSERTALSFLGEHRMGGVVEATQAGGCTSCPGQLGVPVITTLLSLRPAGSQVTDVPAALGSFALDFVH